MTTKPFWIYGRLDVDYIPTREEAGTLEEALKIREDFQDKGLQAKIVVKGNDY